MAIVEKERYHDTSELREFLKALKYKKYILDCGHHITIGHGLGNNLMIINGRELKIICSLCAY
jgi:hypothetical protein